MTPDVYLASSSPRRKELLAQLGVQFAVIVPQVDETRLALEQPEHYVGRLAVAKARAGRQLLQDGSSLTVKPVIGADTCVVVADDLVGKPKNKAHFMHLMEQLSGATHQVYSAVAIAGGLDSTRNTQLTDDTHSGPQCNFAGLHYWSASGIGGPANLRTKPVATLSRDWRRRL
jgi:septum formation protein